MTQQKVHEQVVVVDLGGHQVPGRIFLPDLVPVHAIFLLTGEVGCRCLRSRRGGAGPPPPSEALHPSPESTTHPEPIRELHLAGAQCGGAEACHSPVEPCCDSHSVEMLAAPTRRSLAHHSVRFTHCRTC